MDNALGMPHFIVGNTLPRLDVKAVTVMCPLVSKAAGQVGPQCNVQRLTHRHDSMTHAGRPQLVEGPPGWVTFLHSNTHVYWIPTHTDTHTDRHTTSLHLARMGHVPAFQYTRILDTYTHRHTHHVTSPLV